MTPERRHPREFIDDISVQDDGIEPVRKASAWSRDKLGILQGYLSPFTRACGTTPRFFVDALSSCGLYEMRDNGERLLGSTMIALNADPGFDKCIAMDLDAANVKALRARTGEFGDKVAVIEGDCNQDLITAMQSEGIPDWAPLLVFLDPDGFEVQWSTVEALANYRKGRRKSEILLLAATSGIPRVAAREDDERIRDLLRHSMPPGARWEEIWNLRKSETLTADEARAQLAEEYRAGFEKLGYGHTNIRPITRRDADDASVYHLVFATDVPAGDDIMAHVFTTMYSNQPQLSFDLGDLE